MSKQIQFRRGTSTEHENFTGAIGEITVDTTNKTLRVHDGQTLGGTILAKQSEIPDIANADYVVESQLPTAANNYTWYRKYKSGWVEQGGCAPTINDGPWTITLPIEMADNHYSSVITREYTTYGGTTTDYAYDAVWAKTATGFNCWEKWTGSIALNWHVSGMAAS